jgi:flagellar motility protein MotE (MotC chaperone)
MFEIETELRARVEAQRQAIENTRREIERLREDNERLRAQIATAGRELADIYLLAPSA